MWTVIATENDIVVWRVTLWSHEAAVLEALEMEICQPAWTTKVVGGD